MTNLSKKAIEWVRDVYMCQKLAIVNEMKQILCFMHAEVLWRSNRKEVTMMRLI